MTQQTDPTPFEFVTNWTYNENGWRTSMQRQTGIPATPLQIWQWKYLPNGSVKALIDPANNKTDFEYDGNGRLIKRTDAEGRSWQYAFDQLNRISTVTDPMQQTSETRSYTDNGMLASIEDANGNITNYQYDGFDRLDKRIYPDATFEQNAEYDDNGNVLSFLTRNDDEIVSTFDVLNRLHTRTPGSLPQQTMSYDLAGRLLNINTPTDPGDPTTGDYGFDFDTAGRMIEQSMPDSKTVGYELDDNGNRIKLIYPDGYYAEYFYDELDRLTDIKLNGATSAAIHFDYDDLSRRTMVTYENGCTCSYSWDLNDDMASLKHEFDNDSVDFAFSYNKVHQVTAMSASNSNFVWTPSASKTTIYSTANNLNQYPGVGGTSYSYNNNGCLTGGLLTSASFDELNRLTQAVRAGITNDYWNDPLNRQGQKAIDSVKTGFLYDEQQLIEEYDDNGDLAYRYIRGNKLDEIFMRIAGATKTYFHHDRLGSIIATSNDSGVVQSSYVYSPFGETSSLSGTPFGFTGQRYDGEMGFYNYRARIYSPSIGRFLQPDPIGFDGGSLNLYSYVGNDTLNWRDPFGLIEYPAGFIGPLLPTDTRSTSPGQDIANAAHGQMNSRRWDSYVEAGQCNVFSATVASTAFVHVPFNPSDPGTVGQMVTKLRSNQGTSRSDLVEVHPTTINQYKTGDWVGFSDRGVEHSLIVGNPITFRGQPDFEAIYVSTSGVKNRPLSAINKAFHGNVIGVFRATKCVR